MAGYVVSLARIDHMTEKMQEYIDKAEELITKYGGEYIIRGPAHKITEGEYLHGRAVVIAKFESVEQAEAFILSDIYVKEIKPLRDNTGIYDVSVFESP